MLDGRQITVIAHTLAGRHHQARAILESTHPGDAWENAVTACLSLFVTDGFSADLVNTELSAYLDLGPAENGLVVFHTRLCLTVLDALGNDHPAVAHVAARVIDRAARDGYAARDILAHPACLSLASRQQTRQLAKLVAECGLDAGAIPERQLTQLGAALDTAELVITSTRERAHQPA